MKRNGGLVVGALLVVAAGCLGSPSPSPTGSGDKSDPSSPSSPPPTAATSAPVELDDNNPYLTRDDLQGLTLRVIAGPVEAEAYAEAPDRPAYVVVWNRTGRAHYSEWTPSGSQETTHDVVFPPDPPYLLRFYSPTLVDLRGEAPPGRYLETRVDSDYPEAPHAFLHEYLVSGSHEHTLRVEAGQAAAELVHPVASAMLWHEHGLAGRTSDWARASVIDPRGRDNAHWQTNAAGQIDEVHYWGTVPASGDWTLRLNVTLAASTAAEWVIAHDTQYWTSDVQALGFMWPPDHFAAAPGEAT